MYRVIKLILVDIEKSVKIPVAEIKGKYPGKTLLITAGLDGDEYASIDAAYKIIDKYKNKNFKGTLIIIPILNIPGLQNITSFNPIDNKFPKSLYPGRADGTSSEKLIHWLHKKFVTKSDIWLDLHGAAMTETLEPFLVTAETSNPLINTIIRDLISYYDIPKAVVYKPKMWQKVEKLSQKGIAYIMLESGKAGRRDDCYIQPHLSWIETTMQYLGMINNYKLNKRHTPIYSQVEILKCKKSGLWYPLVSEKINIKQDQLVGLIKDYNGKVKESIYATHSGVYLWGCHGLFYKANNCLIAIGIR